MQIFQTKNRSGLYLILGVVLIVLFLVQLAVAILEPIEGPALPAQALISPLFLMAGAGWTYQWWWARKVPYIRVESGKIHVQALFLSKGKTFDLSQVASLSLIAKTAYVIHLRDGSKIDLDSGLMTEQEFTQLISVLKGEKQ